MRYKRARAYKPAPVGPPAMRVSRPGDALESQAESSAADASFATGLDRVYVHTGPEAAQAAHWLGARAFTVGNHIAFGAGQYDPNSAIGRQLIAHELAHVRQNRTDIALRCPDPETLQRFDQARADIEAHPAYRRLEAKDRAVADEILRRARSRDNCMYYAEQLKLLFDTGEAPAGDIESRWRGEIETEAASEQVRQRDPEYARLSSLEESLAADPSRRWTLVTSRKSGQKFRVDASDPLNIVVQVKVRLQASGRGTAADVANIRAFEEAIEYYASTSGYSVDIVWVSRGGSDVFEPSVDPSKWPTAGNWAAHAHALAHEMHHVMGLEDRYDYIERHAGNPQMKIPDRLHWFRVQMDRAPDPQGMFSLMGGGRQLLDDDVCNVVGGDVAACMAARKGRTDQINNARMAGFARALNAHFRLTGFGPPTPAERFDRPGQPTTRELDISAAESAGSAVLGRRTAKEDLDALAVRLRDRLSPDMSMRAAPPNDTACAGILAYNVMQPWPAVRLCSAFFGGTDECRTRTVMRQAALLNGAGGDAKVSSCPNFDCTAAAADPSSADAVAAAIDCIRRRT